MLTADGPYHGMDTLTLGGTATLVPRFPPTLLTDPLGKV